MPKDRHEGVVVLCVAATLVLAAWQISSIASRQSETIPHEYVVTESGAIDVPADLLETEYTLDDRIEAVRLPRQARWLHGRQVVMRGVMFPTFEVSGLTTYVFSPETQGRGFPFGGSIPLHFFIEVSTPAGHTEAFQPRPITVQGIFEIALQSADGKCIRAYRLRDARIIEKNVRLRYRNPVGYGC
ncbi:MAG: hypothetical protein U0941_22805 [Planctomycetaceae bacterium]